MRAYCLVGLTALLLVGGVLSAGCTAPSTNTSSPSPSATVQAAEQRDPLLENYVNSLHLALGGTKLSSWQVTWENGSAVNVQLQKEDAVLHRNLTENQTILRFKSIDEASNYVDNLDKTGYVATANLASIETKVYQGITGATPTVYKDYVQIKLAGPAYNNIKQINDSVGLQSVSLAKT